VSWRCRPNSKKLAAFPAVLRRKIASDWNSGVGWKIPVGGLPVDSLAVTGTAGRCHKLSSEFLLFTLPMATCSFNEVHSLQEQLRSLPAGDFAIFQELFSAIQSGRYVIYYCTTSSYVGTAVCTVLNAVSAVTRRGSSTELVNCQCATYCLVQYCSQQYSLYCTVVLVLLYATRCSALAGVPYSGCGR
jgi:hypothetical protein